MLQRESRTLPASNAACDPANLSHATVGDVIERMPSERMPSERMASGRMASERWGEAQGQGEETERNPQRRWYRRWAGKPRVD